jgi:hypothetical protein
LAYGTDQRRITPYNRNLNALCGKLRINILIDAHLRAGGYGKAEKEGEDK